jgi:hypothetical protein
VRTPTLTDLNLSAFTISAQFLVFNRRLPTNPVFVGGERLGWLIYRLGPDGVVELRYNSNQSVPCSVKYRDGVWHEATITHDGRTTTLYLDGVAGCRTDAPLRLGNDKVILLTHFGGAATFYGLLRNLTITNGVAVPVRRTPSPDMVAPPPPTDLAPVDVFLATCPTHAQIDAIDKDLQLRFDADPTKDEPLACTNAGGSRSLSPMKKRVYNTLLLMKRLQFDQPLPWTDQPLYTWLTGAIKGIRFRNDIEHSSCCVPPGVIAITTANAVRSTDRWVDPLFRGGLDGFLLVVAHEARHAEGKVHTCGTKDRTLEELGSWGVQYWLARWLAEHTDQTFFTSGPIRYTERLLKEADSIRKTQICQP